MGFLWLKSNPAAVPNTYTKSTLLWPHEPSLHSCRLWVATSARSGFQIDVPALAPTVGQEAGSKRWRKVSLDSAYLDFTRLVGKPEDEDVAAYAFTNVYSATGGKFRLNLTTVGRARAWINGKPPSAMGTRLTMDLAKFASISGRPSSMVFHPRRRWPAESSSSSCAI